MSSQFVDRNKKWLEGVNTGRRSKLHRTAAGRYSNIHPTLHCSFFDLLDVCLQTGPHVFLSIRPNSRMTQIEHRALIIVLFQPQSQRV
jgi:hypothetical protein